MENRTPVPEGADIAKDILKNPAGIMGILSHPAAGMGIGAHGDNFTAQFFEAAEDIGRGEKITAAVHAAGIHFQTLALCNQYPENFIDDFPVLFVGNRTGCRMAFGFADVG